VYVYPEGWGAEADTGEDAALNWGDAGKEGVGGEAQAEPLAEAWDEPDLLVLVEMLEHLPEGTLAEPAPEAAAETVTATETGSDTEAGPDTVTGPETPTLDCDPLGIPEKWAGTFDGDILSNIPDISGYTFNGPVYGDMSFSIVCFNQKYVVSGALKGGATNCALATGCPFTATMTGYYDLATKTISGTLTEGVIDFSLVKVLAAGTFEGTLGAGPSLEGSWQGEKTGITPASLSWVTATGEGTWEAGPE
jgi:hypothetical protein